MNIGLSSDEKKKRKSKKEAEEQKAVIYYCTRGQNSFDLPKYELDEFGKPITDADGNKKQLFTTDALGNNKTAMNDRFRFERLPIIDGKTGKVDPTKNIGQFIIQPDHPRREELISKLEQSRKNVYNGILTEDEYKKQFNAEAFKFESENRRLNDTIADQQTEIDRLRDLLKQKGVEV